MESVGDILEILKKLPRIEGITPTSMLDLPDPLGSVLRKMTRRGWMSLGQFASELNLSEDEAHQIGEVLMEKGFLVAEERSSEGGVVYRVYFSRMRGRNIPIDL